MKTRTTPNGDVFLANHIARTTGNLNRKRRSRGQIARHLAISTAVLGLIGAVAAIYNRLHP